MIKVVIFDVGGVLLDLNRELCIRNFKAIGFSGIGEMLDNCHQKGVFRLLETGMITEDEFYAECGKLVNPGTTSEQIRDTFLSFANTVQPYKLEFIKELSQKYDLYVLSNNNPIVVRDFERIGSPYGVSFETTFKKCFFSYQLKLLKPDPEFYRIVIREIGLPAKEMLFVDDNRTNVEVACREGMTGVWYDVNTNLRDCVLTALK